MMPSRKLLMLINFFPPTGGGGVYRPLSFVKNLSRMGWDITVVTSRPGEFWISDPSLLKQIPEDVRVIRTGSLSASRIHGKLKGRRVGESAGTRSSRWFELMRRAGESMLLPDTYIGWKPFAVKAASRLCREEKFDAIYSTSPPDSTQLAALKISSRFGIPWLADLRDPWISLYLRDPVSPVHRSILEGMERRVALGASTVVVTTQWQKDELERRIPSCNAVRIPNGFDEEDFRGDLDAPPRSPLRITHCGMLTLGRRSGVFLDGLTRFFESVPGARGNVKVTFIGARESANEEMERTGFEGAVSFEDNMPHAGCIGMERRSHILLLIKHDEVQYNGLVPGKLYEYIGACRPILALAPQGEAFDIVTSLRRGETAGLSDPGEVAAALERIYSAYADGRLDEAYDLSPRPEFSRRAAAQTLSHELGLIADGEGKA